METKQPGGTQKNQSQPAASRGSSKEQFFSVGPREKPEENFGDVWKALGVVGLLVHPTLVNAGLLVGATILSFISPGLANNFFPSFNPADSGSYVQFFLSTFPLLLGTTLYVMLILTKGFKTLLGALFALVIIFGLSIYIGGFFGLGRVQLSDLQMPSLPPGANLGQVLGLFAGSIMNLFLTKYGPYRFYVTIFAGIVLAWALIVKTKTKRSAAPAEKGD